MYKKNLISERETGEREREKLLSCTSNFHFFIFDHVSFDGKLILFFRFVTFLKQKNKPHSKKIIVFFRNCK